MADNDLLLKDYSPTPNSFYPRVRDRGNNVKENVHSIARTDGTLIDPATSQQVDKLVTNENPVQGVIDMPTAGQAYTAGRAVEVVTTTAGTIKLTYSDNSTRTRAFGIGLTRLPDAVIQWDLPSGSTFVGTLCNLK